MAEAGVMRPRQSALLQDLATIRVLASRDLLRFYRERTRVVGALAQPILFWLVIGSGMSSTFRLSGAEGLGYREYFFPGVAAMVVLFSAIFATMSLIEDRHAGLLQAVLVAPGSRAAVVIGKSLGSTMVALSQAALFLLLSPLAGFGYAAIDWALVLGALSLLGLGLSAFGFVVAWWLDSTQGYHVVMSLVLLPAWILSGAMFPLPSSGALGLLAHLNPMTHAVALLREGMYDGVVPGASTSLVLGMPLGLLAGFAAVSVALATFVCERRR